MSPPRPIFVAGCPRSGTSPFARWLHACGLSTVADQRRNERYPSGYFEPLPLLMFHKSLERLPRGADHRITTEPYLTQEIMDLPYVASSFEHAFESVLHDDIDFLKYPQLALSIDFLLERFPQAHLIGLWRSPLSSFRSLITHEFPLEMIPASGVKAVLLWSVYASHLVSAKRSRPEQVTLVGIDGFFADEATGPTLLERIGHDPASAVPIGEAIDRTLWHARTSLPWRAYHAAMAGLCRAMKSRLGPQRAPLADQRAWLRQLRELTDFGSTPAR